MVLSALFDEPLCLVHGVVWLEKAGGEVAGRDSHHVLDPSPVWPIVHELDVELLGDPEMTWLLVSRVFKDGATTALARGTGWQRENRLVNRKVWNQKVGNRSCYPLVASFCHCVLFDRPVGNVYLQIEKRVVRLVVVHHEHVVVGILQFVVVVRRVVRAVPVDEHKGGFRVVNAFGHLARRLLFENARRNCDHCCFRAGKSF